MTPSPNGWFSIPSRPKKRLTCECDYDFEDGRYHKCSHYCPTHDECEEECGRMGEIKDPTFDKTKERRPRWLCHDCVLAEALDEYAYPTHPILGSLGGEKCNE